MIAEAIAIARRRGCQRVELTSSASRKDAHRFYERLGFTASHVGMKLMLKGERCLTDKCAVERRGYAPGEHGKSRRVKETNWPVWSGRRQ